ncbi:MAG TPA: hypothetical protein VFB12_05830 [Ktedonobacteraceae bacterium]|nr:hypothetical protein [Ktedonobacteraceae bacterium]
MFKEYLRGSEQLEFARTGTNLHPIVRSQLGEDTFNSASVHLGFYRGGAVTDPPPQRKILQCTQAC